MLNRHISMIVVEAPYHLRHGETACEKLREKDKRSVLSTVDRSIDRPTDRPTNPTDRSRLFIHSFILSVGYSPLFRRDAVTSPSAAVVVVLPPNFLAPACAPRLPPFRVAPCGAALSSLWWAPWRLCRLGGRRGGCRARPARRRVLRGGVARGGLPDERTQGRRRRRRQRRRRERWR